MSDIAVGSADKVKMFDCPLPASMAKKAMLPVDNKASCIVQAKENLACASVLSGTSHQPVGEIRPRGLPANARPRDGPACGVPMPPLYRLEYPFMYPQSIALVTILKSHTNIF